MKKTELSELNYLEFKEEKERIPLILIPVGAMEWHDLHLPIGYDYLKAVELCKKIAERVGGAVSPPISFGYAYHFTKDPIRSIGTFCPNYEALESYILSLGRMFIDTGYKVLYFLSGHYERIQIYLLKSIGRRLEHYAIESGTTIKCLVHHEPDYTIRKGISQNAKEDYVRTELGLDYMMGDHAGFYETSLGLALFPNLVKEHLISENYFDEKRGGKPSTKWGEKWIKMIVDKSTMEIKAALEGKDISAAEPIE